jgi:nucleotide-binding universal stress UspA family protein
MVSAILETLRFAHRLPKEPFMIATLMQVLVHLDSTPASALRLQAARELAGQHGAALAAMYAVSSTLAAGEYGYDLTGAVAQTMADIDEGRRTAAHSAFERALKDHPGIKPTWAESCDYPVAGSFIGQALYADLLVLGQSDPATRGEVALPFDFIESVLIGSGKPALIIPYIGGFKAAGETAVIAWKPTRESARAVAAAMPLLQKAAIVHVLSWGTSKDTLPVHGSHLSLEGYLRQHGVNAHWHLEGGEPTAVGEMLLSRVADLEGDLLVMGCYGHSRTRELVMGGASRVVLKSMTVPVLLAH